MSHNREEELIRNIAIDKKRQPKALRAETKTRTMMFKESLRIGTVVWGEFFKFLILLNSNNF